MKYTCFQIHAVPSGLYMEKRKYKFIAEFSDENMAFDFLCQLRASNQYSSMDLILTKDICEKRRKSRETIDIVTTLGEQLPVWNMDID